MKNILSLIEEIELLMKQKICTCTHNSCNCSDETKNKYFWELKKILARFNREYSLVYPTIMNFSKQSTNRNSIIHH